MSLQCVAAQGPVDWTSLLHDLVAYQEGPDFATPIRWLTLCISAQWVARLKEVWDYCQIGGAIIALHASMCAESGILRAEAYARTILQISPIGWSDFLLYTDWPVFETIASHAHEVAEHWDIAEKELLASLTNFIVDPFAEQPLAGSGVVVPELESMEQLKATALKIVAWSKDVGASQQGLIEFTQFARSVVQEEVRGGSDAVLAMCVGGRNLLETGIAPSEPFCLACVLSAAMTTDTEEIDFAIKLAETFFAALHGNLNLIPAMLHIQWPVADLLGAFHRALRPIQKLNQDQWGITFGPNALVGSLMVRVVTKDTSFPWIAPLARAVAFPGLLVTEFPWPQFPAPSFQEVRDQAMQLAMFHQWSNFPSPSNYGQSWRALCLVCVGGSQDATTRDAGELPFVKTPLLAKAPALERFIDLFGSTGRVRLSSVKANGGLIRWHPDANVVENGRLILHLPLQTTPRALNRLGHLLFHFPEGRLHWADYSFPHTVYNGDPDIDRIHLIIDVNTLGNTAFEQNFLQRLPSEQRDRLLATALPKYREAASHTSTTPSPTFTFAPVERDHVNGVLLGRPLATQLARLTGELVSDPTMQEAERVQWANLEDAVFRVG